MTCQSPFMLFGMRKSISVPAMLLLPLILESARALEWGVIDNFMKGLKCSINKAKDFESQINDLEYTVIQTDEYKEKLNDLICYYSEICNHNKPDDVLTVIDIRRNTKSVADESMLMSDIITCLKKHVFEGNNSENFTNNLQIGVHTMRYNDLTNFEMLSKDLDDVRRINDYIQMEVHNCIYNKIQSQIERVFHDLMFGQIVEYFAFLFGPSHCHANDSQSKCLVDIKSNLINSLTDVEFTNKVCFEIIREFENDPMCFDHIISNTKDLQNEINCSYYDVAATRVKIGTDIYNKFRYAGPELVNRIRTQLANNLRAFDVGQMKTIYEQLFVRIYDFLFCEEVVTQSDHAQNLALINQLGHAESDLLHKSNNALFEAIGFQDIVQDAKNKKTVTFFKYKLPYCDKYIRIVCNETITQGNLHLLCHILNNANIKINSAANQTLYMNLRQGSNLEVLYRSIYEKHICKGHSFFVLPQKDKIIKKYILTTKSKGYGCISAYNIDLDLIISKSNANLHLSSLGLVNTIHNILIDNLEISNLKDSIKIYQKDIYGFNLFESNMRQSNYPDLRFDRKIVVVIYDGIMAYDMTIRASGDENNNLSLTAQPNLPFIVSIGNNIFRPGDAIEIDIMSDASREKFLTNLLRYVENLQLMSKVVKHHDFINPRILTKYYREVDLSINANPSYRIEEQLNDNHLMVQGAIYNFYGRNQETQEIYSNSFRFTDILERNEDYEAFMNNIKPFLSRNGISQTDFGGIFEEFLIDENRINATNDADIANVKTDNYEILVHVVATKNSNALVYLVRRDLEHDLRVLPHTFTMNAFISALNNHTQDTGNRLLRFFASEGKCRSGLVTSIFKTMIKLQFNLLGNIRKQFEERKEEFVSHFHTLIDPSILNSFPKIDTSRYEPVGAVQTGFLINVMELEIKAIIEILEESIAELKSKALIRITTVSLIRPSKIEMKAVNAFNHFLKSME